MVVNLLPKLRGYSVKIATTTLAPHFTACSDTTWLHFALAFTPLSSSLCSIELRYHIHDVLIPVMERVAGRPELLHVSDQQGSIGP